MRVVADKELVGLMERMDVVKVIEETFKAMGSGEVGEPIRATSDFPMNKGDFSVYMGALSNYNVYGVKVASFIPHLAGSINTSWTMLMSMVTGEPILLCDTGVLTRLRTAATTVAAVNKLAAGDAKILSVVGSGEMAYAHLKCALKIRAWEEIRVFSPGLCTDGQRKGYFRAVDDRVQVAFSTNECVKEADVIMLCTSSTVPVLNVSELAGKYAVITSVSALAHKSYEIAPQELTLMDVYCDSKARAPEHAYEMRIAEEQGWSRQAIKGDLTDILMGWVDMPKFDRHVFFRTVGTGLEDIAMAYALLGAR